MVDLSWGFLAVGWSGKIKLMVLAFFLPELFIYIGRSAMLKINWPWPYILFCYCYTAIYQIQRGLYSLHIRVDWLLLQSSADCITYSPLATIFTQLAANSLCVFVWALKFRKSSNFQHIKFKDFHMFQSLTNQIHEFVEQACVVQIPCKSPKIKHLCNQFIFLPFPWKRQKR